MKAIFSSSGHIGDNLLNEESFSRSVNIDTPSNTKHKLHCCKRFCSSILNCCKASKKVITKKFQTNSPNDGTTPIYNRKRAIIKEIIQLNKMNEWDQFFQFMQEKIKEKGITEQLMKYFHEDSQFIQIWRGSFSIFIVIIVYIYFFKYLCIHIHDEERPLKSIQKVYLIINIMFSIDCLISVVQLFTTYSKFMKFFYLFFVIPIKAAMSFPFALEVESIYLISFKFLRLDLIETLFALVKNYCYSMIDYYIHVSWLKVLMSYINEIFKYLLVFVLYAHFIACIYANVIITTVQNTQLHVDLNEFYVECLYFTLQTFTTIGYGDISPKNKISVLLVIVNMYIGVNLFFLITTNIKMLYSRLNAYKKENLLQLIFERFIFQIQKNTGKVFPNNLKKSIYSFLILKRGLSFPDIFERFEKVFKICRTDIKNEILLSLFDFFYKEYAIFFSNCSKDFVNKIFSALEPKVYNKYI